MEQGVPATSSEIPPFTENITIPEVVSETVTEPDEDWLWPSDPDVELATQITMAIAVIFIVKAIFDAWQSRRRQRAASRMDENAERNQIITQRRISEALHQSSHECPICLANASFPVLTDCGHIFCCECIIQYWQQSKAIVTPCDCAMCRSTFYMLLPVHWPTMGTSEETDDHIQENNIRIDDYNRRFSINRPVLDYIRDIPILIPYLIRNFFNNDIFTLVYQVRIGFVFICVITYFLLPSDMVPESIYGIIGFLDDCIIGILVFGAMFRWLREYMADRGLARN
ncbi:E3 ubiquitin-protein ligase RNF170 [Caenorhabditis elegans]|uniref:E3 ubiquitin-protein ligase RNF170 n=1 Tax=Caenorhabditis elegans TaxID=6239 RepID=Q9XWM0_CAEEL|nr:RING-type domain-containing protein [Caenorhabditis elegans]CAA21635.1 RING-type domain-containing protein [Caenorhabditis elegans]|eukprot:NP_496760.1 Uncharacterized protein CELE_Y38F1A.2 [Caenorhabditis elegans]